MHQQAHASRKNKCPQMRLSSNNSHVKILTIFSSLVGSYTGKTQNWDYAGIRKGD
jgi:hypothetical protein